MVDKPTPPKVIDLGIESYRVDRGDKGAPFWGDGIPQTVVFVITAVCIAMLGGWLKPMTDGLYYGLKHAIGF